MWSPSPAPNQIHGSLWEFNRNNTFAARNFFLPTVAALNQNQYGASAGGPIRRDRLFLFGTIQWMKIRQGRNSTGQFPRPRRWNVLATFRDPPGS